MNPADGDLAAAIARHEREIGELRRQIEALHEGHAREQVQAQIDRRIAELQAEIDLQELQETMAREAAEKARKRFRRRERGRS